MTERTRLKRIQGGEEGDKTQENLGRTFKSQDSKHNTCVQKWWGSLNNMMDEEKEGCVYDSVKNLLSH